MVDINDASADSWSSTVEMDEPELPEMYQDVMPKCPSWANSLPSKASGGGDDTLQRDDARPLDLLDEVRDDDSSEGII